MHHFPILVFLTFWASALPAQEPTPFCAASDVRERLLREQPDLGRKGAQLEAAYRAAIYRFPASAKAAPPPYTLPVVFHIVHENGPENVSDERVRAGLEHANEAFANQGFYDRGTGVDTRIQFCLATRTPDNLPTDGITRTQDPLTRVNYRVEDRDLKALVQWDPTEYINIYVVDEICQEPGSGCWVAGYAYYPSAHGSGIDGVVVEARWLGNSRANAGVLIHELGHYLGLRHTFEGGCRNDDCTRDGDAVCDTPPDASKAAVPCTGSVNTCTTDTDSGFAADQDDQIDNYMDYGSFSCYSTFTAGQRERMHFFLDGRRRSLQESFGCREPCPELPVAGFSGGTDTIEVGTTVNFTNTSTGTDTYTWRVNGTVTAGTRNYTRTFATEGFFTVSLLAGSTDDRCPPDSLRRTFRVVCSGRTDFGAPPDIVENIGVTLTNLSSAGGISSSWTVNGTEVSTDSGDLDYTFPTTGVYEVCLRTDFGGCARERCRLVFVRPETTGGGGAPGDCGEPFQYTYRDPFGERESNFFSTVAHPAGGYVIGGTMGGQPLVMHVAPDGSVLWQTQLFPSGSDGFVRDLIIDADGFVGGIGGATPFGDLGLVPNGFAFRLNAADGTVVWARTYFFGDPVVFHDLHHRRSGNPYEILGAGLQSGSGGTLTRSGFFLRVAADLGNSLAGSRYLRTESVQYDEALVAGDDYLTVGSALTTGNTETWLSTLRPTLDLAGSDRWQPTAGTDIRHRGIAGTPANFVVAGPGNGGSILVTAHTSSTLPRWSSEYLHTEPIRVVDVTLAAGGYLILARTGTGQAILLALASDGALRWAKAYETVLTAGREGSALFADAQGIVIAGAGIGATGVAGRLLRLNALGEGPTDCSVTTDVPLRRRDRVTTREGLPVLTRPAQGESERFFFEPANLELDPAVCAQRCPEEEICGNQQDDDLDGLTDCEDPDLRDSCCCLAAPVIDLGEDAGFCGPAILRPDTVGVGWSFSWSVGATGDSLVVREPGTYQLTVTDTCGRTATSSVTLHPRPRPELDLSLDTLVCENAVVPLRVPDDFTTVEWSDGTTDRTFTIWEAGTYWVRATDSCGREHSDTLRVRIRPETVIDLGPDTTICRGDTLLLSVAGFTDHQWSESSYLDCSDCPTVRYFPETDTVLLVSATLGPGCIGSDSLRVFVLSEPGVRDTVLLCPDDTLLLDGRVITEAGDYTTASVGTTCAVVDTIEVLFRPVSDPLCGPTDTLPVDTMGMASNTFYIPTAFSPNGDRVNDEFYPYFSDSVATVVRLAVYDRWGGLAFEATDADPNDRTRGWDGRSASGKPYPVGVYVYQLQVRLRDGTVLTTAGEVMVLR